MSRSLRPVLLVVVAMALAACGSSTPASSVRGPVTLGYVAHPSPRSGKGWGQVRPTEIYNGGDETGLVTGITWSTWGGPKAVGHGIGWYVSPSEDVAEGSQVPATIVAFQRTTCDGHRVYRAVEWYFPSKGGSFLPNQYETYCGSFGYS